PADELGLLLEPHVFRAPAAASRAARYRSGAADGGRAGSGARLRAARDGASPTCRAEARAARTDALSHRSLDSHRVVYREPVALAVAVRALRRHAQRLAVSNDELERRAARPAVLVDRPGSAAVAAGTREVGVAHPDARGGDAANDDRRRMPQPRPARPVYRVRSLRPLPADLARHRPTARRPHHLDRRGVHHWRRIPLRIRAHARA